MKDRVVTLPGGKIPAPPMPVYHVGNTALADGAALTAAVGCALGVGLAVGDGPPTPVDEPGSRL
jgi:hypothetical protein